MNLMTEVEDASEIDVGGCMSAAEDPKDLLIARQDELIALQERHIGQFGDESRRERELNEKAIQLLLEIARIRVRNAVLAGLSAGIAISIIIGVFANWR